MLQSSAAKDWSRHISNHSTHCYYKFNTSWFVTKNNNKLMRHTVLLKLGHSMYFSWLGCSIKNANKDFKPLKRNIRLMFVNMIDFFCKCNKSNGEIYWFGQIPRWFIIERYLKTTQNTNDNRRYLSIGETRGFPCSCN